MAAEAPTMALDAQPGGSLKNYVRMKRDVT